MTEDRSAYYVALSYDKLTERLDEIAELDSNDAEIADLRDLADEMWSEANRLAGINARLCRDHNALLAQLARQPVYVEADVGWCIRHDDVLVRHSNPAVCNTHMRYLATPYAHHPAMFPDHDPGRCVPVALYRQAEDP